MKKIKRIICIFFATIICFSTVACSGACYESCFSIVFSNRIKNGKLEAEKQKKALDSTPIEVDGYKLKIDWTDKLHETDDTWVTLMDCYFSCHYSGFTSEYNGKIATLKATFEYNNEEQKGDYIFSLIENEANEIVEKQLSIDWKEIGAEYEAVENFIIQEIAIEEGMFCLDGVWFILIQYISNADVWTRNKYYTATLDFPPLFYMLDFENQELLYAGYADGWYEELKNQSYLNMPEMPYIKIERS